MTGWIILGVVILLIAAAVAGAIAYKNNKDKIAKAEAAAKQVVSDIKK